MSQNTLKHVKSDPKTTLKRPKTVKTHQNPPKTTQNPLKVYLNTDDHRRGHQTTLNDLKTHQK